MPGKRKSDPRILEYFKDSKLNFGTVEDTQMAWCGSFAAWVMIRNGITPPKDSFRATEWLNFGQRLDKPVYGAIGLKPRKGGGHVSFIVGQSEDGVYYYMLGGNQKNSVRVSKYLASVWTGFVFPSGMSACPIPIYGGAAEAAGSEA